MVRLLAVFIQLPDVNSSLRLARLLGRGLYRIYGGGRQRAIEHLQLSFPDKDLAWCERTACRSFEHIVMLVFDLIYTPRLIRTSSWHHYVDLSEIVHLRHVLRLMIEGRGIIMVTGHYGNFIVLGCALATFGLETHNIARPIDNPHIDRYVYGRLFRNQTIIYKKGATDTMLERLEGGGVLGFIADQNAGKKGLFVDFFGRKASTYKSIGLLALEYNLPVVIGYCRRIEDRFRFKLGVSRTLYPAEWQSQADPLRWITAEYTKAIEQFVREEPEQYWWVHRRWKTRPAEELRDKGI